MRQRVTLETCADLALRSRILDCDVGTRVFHSEIDARHGYGVILRVWTSDSGVGDDFGPDWSGGSIGGFFPFEVSVARGIGVRFLHHGAGGATDDPRILASGAEYHLDHSKKRGFQKNGILERQALAAWSECFGKRV